MIVLFNPHGLNKRSASYFIGGGGRGVIKSPPHANYIVLYNPYEFMGLTDIKPLSINQSIARLPDYGS